MFVIKRRSTGKIVARDFPNREAAKSKRDEMNLTFYEKHPPKQGVELVEDTQVPLHNREFFVTRSYRHIRGAAKNVG